MTEEQKKYYNAMKKLGSKKPQKPIPRPLVSQAPNVARVGRVCWGNPEVPSHNTANSQGLFMVLLPSLGPSASPEKD